MNGLAANLKTTFVEYPKSS